MSYDPHCTLCCGATMYDENMEPALCADHSWDLHMERINHQKFIEFELSKFRSLIDAAECGLITTEDFYARICELVEPF